MLAESPHAVGRAEGGGPDRVVGGNGAEPAQHRFTLRGKTGKAAVLQYLQVAGFRVPEFVVSPPDLGAAVQLLGVPLVVRSSTTLEDGHAASFAGQFESYLNLWTVDDVEDAVRKCRESVRASGVVEYCNRSGIDPRELRMEVIVQRMIRPELAGVAFTVNPMTGAEEIVIEACEGLAAELLAGRTSALPSDHPLLQRFRHEIERTAREIQRHFGAPQDIEFAIEDGTLYIVQARPITRIRFSPAIGEWTNADFRDGGVSSGVCSPLMWSLYEFIWESSLKDSLRELKLFDRDFEAGRMFFGRPYWNLGALKECAARLPGFVEREFDSDLNVQILYDGLGRTTTVSVLGVLRAIPTLVAVGSFLRNQVESAERWLDGRFDEIERRYEQIPDDADARFRELIERDYFAVETSYFRTIFAASLAKLEFKRSFPDADFSALVAALPELSHMAPVRALRAAVAAGSRDVTPIVERFRHQSLRGLDIRLPRWGEDRDAVQALLDTLPDSGRTDPGPAYEHARADAAARLPTWRRRSFNRKLDRLRHLVWLREEMRDLSSRLYYLIRRHVLEIARRRAIGDDIFFMAFREIFADDRSGVQRNREILERYRNFQAPNEIGDRFHFDARPARGELRGIAASRGTAQGAARIAQSVEEAAHIEPGAILVAPFTDPGWTPVLGRVAAVVTENGGLLSHAAVICREFGIPAVLGVPGATRRIREGSTITVNGDTGCVDQRPFHFRSDR
jgi:pyruvate,water dikinase